MGRLPRNVRVTIGAGGKLIRQPTRKQLDAQYQPYAAELGKLIYAWNGLHEKLAELFGIVTAIPNAHTAFAIWHSTPSDLSQRKMLRAAASSATPALAKSQKAKDDILWVLDKIDHSLSSRRNDAMHAPLEFATSIEGTLLQVADFPTGNPRAKALKGKDLLNEFIWYRETASVLTLHVHLLCWHLRDPEQRPLPGRPQMPHLTQTANPKVPSGRKTPKSPPRQP